jgi:hypothetical protein
VAPSECTPLSGRHAPDVWITLGEADGAAATRRARAKKSATSGEDTVMAPASVGERERPPGSRSPFDTEGSGSAEDRRRPEVALA